MMLDRKKNELIALSIIFILAILLRLGLAVTNNDFNDNHFDVIKIIQDEHRIPQKNECHQCYHAKLFHASAAIILSVVPIQTEERQLTLLQLINTLTGCISLVFIYRFLKKFKQSTLTTLITFSLVALNPAFIAINAQATNDSFVILFGILALYYLHAFLLYESKKSFCLMTLFTILAILSKGSGLVIFLGISIILAVKTLTSAGKRQQWIYMISLFLASCFIAALFFGPYYVNLKKYGDPFVINKEKQAFPHFFQKTYVGGKTGVTSIAESYFTFKLGELMKNPYINQSDKSKEQFDHVHSLWTQLYARTNFIQFEGTPRDWRVSKNKLVLNTGRTIFIIALLPLAIFLVGIYQNIKNTWRAWRSKGISFFRDDPDWIYVFFSFLFLAFIIKITLDYREYITMKPMYIYSGMIFYAKIFLDGLEFAYLKANKSRTACYALSAPLILLCVLYVFDISLLINKLFWKMLS